MPSPLPIDRPLEIAAFLAQHGWDSAHAEPFDGDFSPRRYARLTQSDKGTAILMDADRDQRTPQFIAVAGILRRCGLNAPDIYAALPHQGLVLMQDFGTQNLGAWLDQGHDPRPFLRHSVEILAQMHSRFNESSLAPSDLPAFNLDYFIGQAELFLDVYFLLVKNREASANERRDFRAAWRTALTFTQSLPHSLVLRDFMPDNLMLLPNSQLGVLDFQDAGIGCIAYDLASLCEVVRRDGMFDFLPELLSHYRAHLSFTVSESDLSRACIVLSAQRHTRILGIVTRLTHQQNHADKRAYLPRLRQHLHRLLTEACLLPVREWMQAFDEVGS